MEKITPKPDCSVVWEPDPDTGFYSLAVSADEIFSLLASARTSLACGGFGCPTALGAAMDEQK